MKNMFSYFIIIVDLLYLSFKFSNNNLSKKFSFYAIKIYKKHII